MIQKSDLWTATKDVFLLVAGRVPDALSLACASVVGLLVAMPFASEFPMLKTLLFAHVVLWIAAVAFVQRTVPPGRTVSWPSVFWGFAISSATATAAILFALVALSRGIPEASELVRAARETPSLILTVALAPFAVVAGRHLLRADIEREAPDREMARRNEEALSVIFHELRRPLTVLVASSQMAMDTDISESERSEMLQSVHRQALRLGSYLEELLECSRIQASRLRISRRPLNLPNLVMEVTTEFGDGFDSPIHVALQDERPIFVSGDMARIKLIMRNLISNAIKYSPAHSPVRVSIGMYHGRAIINVDDEGPGIPEPYRARIFEQYFRLPGSASGGFGLGLYLSRQLVKAHSGEIHVEDGPYGGARFVITLPALMIDTESGIRGRSTGPNPLARTRSD